MSNVFNDKELLKKAFKKLKSNIYYDKTNITLRDKIVSFEYRLENIDAYFDELWGYFIDTTSETPWSNVVRKIEDSIDCIVLPKSIKQPKSNQGFISNFISSPNVNIDKTNTFIDMDIEGHLFGILWLFTIGWKLDKDLDYCYGNRIRKSLYNEFSDSITYSPYLFEPYFEKYESWRDIALKEATKHLDKNEDVVITTLDFSSYYYSVDITQELFDNILSYINTDSNNILISRLNNLIFTIIKKFSQKYQSLFDNFPKRNILPIGFLPSNVLANWCLKKFDEAILDGWNPVYYGRYVDDILIVDKIEKNSIIYEQASKGNLTVDDIISFYMINENRWNGLKHHKNYDAVFQPVKEIDENNETVTSYYLLHKYIDSLGPATEIKVQNKKANVFYFRSGESEALITCFRENISKNKSEFRRMPEDDAVFQKDDYSEIFKLHQKGINKLREVSGITLERYNFSKYLGKYQRIAGLINDKSESSFVTDIEKILNSENIIDMYSHWEKIITIFVINGYFDELKNFIEKVINSIQKIEFENIYIKNNIMTSLYRFVYSGLIRAYSLCFSEKLSAIIDDFYIPEQYSLLPRDVFAEAYMITRMSDKSLCAIWPDLIIQIYKLREESDMPCICYNIEVIKNLVFKYSENPNLSFERALDSDYPYYPYMVTMYDLAISCQYMQMLIPNNYSSIYSNINLLNQKYVELNYRDYTHSSHNVVIKKLEDSGQTAIKVTGKLLNKIKVAISSIKMRDENFESIVKGSPDRSYKRYQEISSLVNTAISQNADMLVMPEACLPMEWLGTLARTCAKNNLAAITGIEHFIADKKVYNLTAVILPFDSGSSRKCSQIIFHSKNHFAPNEKRLIAGYGLSPMDYEGLEKKDVSYELYDWNDFWFTVYCCYELSSIKDRSIFQSLIDAVIAVEWNRDINYYSNILESLSRDMHCYCIQVNTSDYGDSRITQPSKTEKKDIIRTKGGDEPSILVGTIDLKSLRDFQIKKYELQREDNRFKPTPPQFDSSKVLKKINNTLWDNIT